MAPAAVLVYLAFLATVAWLFRGRFRVHAEIREAVLGLDEREVITDARLLRRSLVVIGLTLLAFLVQGPLGYEPATIALAGATVLMLVARLQVHEVLREVEWPTLFFFIGLFMLVEGIVHVGIVSGIADWLLEATRGDQAVATIGLLWLSGIASAIVDNIPYTATAIPIVQEVGAGGGLEIEPLWWALALGACLGGNATIVGASANVVVANVAGRAGHPIGFVEYFRYGSIVVLESLVICTVYLWVRYLT
jgi:Na+/H+ antiporter NhaD/arsenite permease-like protein